jgi:hypothetical protein
MIFKFNFFCKQAKSFLLSNELNKLPALLRLKPLTDFLTGKRKVINF